MLAQLLDAARRIVSWSPAQGGVPVGRTITLTATPQADLAAFATGELLGGLLHLKSIQGDDAVREPGGGGVIQSVRLVDMAAQNLALDVVLFTDKPVNTTLTEQSALDVADIDLRKGAHIISIAATDYDSFADNSQATVANVGQAFQMPRHQSQMYAVLVARGAIDLVAANDLVLFVDILAD